MDSERRPDAENKEKNDLDVLLRVKAPEFFQKHAANVLLGVLLVAAICVFIYQKKKQKDLELHATNLNTAIAYNNAMQLREMMTQPDLSDAAARDRQNLFGRVAAAADQVIASDSDSTQKAAAQLAKAEALWSLAIAPAQALATTQPVAGFTAKPQSAYMEDARAAYYEILQKYPNEKEIAANALLSIAAICESGGKLDDAHDWYSKVIKDTTLRGVYRDVAKARIERLADLKKPFTLAPPTPATQPTTSTSPTLPAEVSQPTAPATTAPATQP